MSNGTDLSNLCLAQRRKDAKEVSLSYAYFSDIRDYVVDLNNLPQP